MELLFFADRKRSAYEITKDGDTIYTCEYDLKREKKTVFNPDESVAGFGIYTTPFTRLQLTANPYELHFNDQIVIVTKHRQSFANAYTACNFNGHNYTSIEHFGKKISLFKNDVQIGYFVKEGNRFKNEKWSMQLIANSDENELFLILWCLKLYSNFSLEDNPSFTISFNRKKIDKDWKPKE